MVGTIIVIVILVITFIISVIFIKNSIVLSDILHHFKKGNCIVYGKKGCGKDLLTQWVIKKRGCDYWSNINYGYKFHPITTGCLSVAPNTFENFIDNDIKKPKVNRLFENEDIYLSDVGVYLPSQYDSLLHKKFPSFPIYYALSRHLASHNIHANTQNLERAWKALREQADFFIRCKKTFKLLGLLITTGYTYEEYNSAKLNLLPFPKPLIESKESKSLREQFNATNGQIQKFFVIQKIKNIKYDTRAFEKIVYGDEPRLIRKDIYKRIRENHKQYVKISKLIKQKQHYKY